MKVLNRGLIVAITLIMTGAMHGYQPCATPPVEIVGTASIQQQCPAGSTLQCTASEIPTCVDTITNTAIATPPRAPFAPCAIVDPNNSNFYLDCPAPLSLACPVNAAGTIDTTPSNAKCLQANGTVDATLPSNQFNGSCANLVCPTGPNKQCPTDYHVITNATTNQALCVKSDGTTQPLPSTCLLSTCSTTPKCSSPYTTIDLTCPAGSSIACLTSNSTPACFNTTTKAYNSAITPSCPQTSCSACETDGTLRCANGNIPDYCDSTSPFAPHCQDISTPVCIHSCSPTTTVGGATVAYACPTGQTVACAGTAMTRTCINSTTNAPTTATPYPVYALCNPVDTLTNTPITCPASTTLVCTVDLATGNPKNTQADSTCLTTSGTSSTTPPLAAYSTCFAPPASVTFCVTGSQRSCPTGSTLYCERTTQNPSCINNTTGAAQPLAPCQFIAHPITGMTCP